jgi:hypothetical protein
MATFRKKTFLRRFRAQFFVRFHMALILVGTALSGLLASKALLAAGAWSMTVRYPLAVLLSYLAFFLFVKIWLWHVSASPPGGPARSPDAAEIATDVVDLPFSPSSAVEKAIRFGGGQAGGGGAGGAFDAAANVAARAAVPVPDAAVAADAAGKAAAGAADAAGEAASGLLDADELVLPLVLLCALLAAVLGAGIYLVWEAPSILPDAAFDAALAASLLRGAKRVEAPDWTAGVFRATWKPFLWVVAVTVAFALVAGLYFPHARKIADMFMRAG